MQRGGYRRVPDQDLGASLTLVGKTTSVPSPGQVARSPELLEAEKSWHPLKYLHHPHRGGHAELGSLKLQAGRRLDADPPPDYIRTMEEYAIKHYPRVDMSYASGLLDDPDALREHIREHLLPSLKADASPGIPLMRLADTNRELLEKYPDILVNATLERILLLSSGDLPRLEDNLAYVEEGYTDPVRLFVKAEPHSQAKYDAGRWRLISSCSVVTQLVERFFASAQNQAEIDIWNTIPSAPGIGFTDEASSALYTRVMAQGTNTSTDIRGWDWSVQGWELEGEAYMRLALMDGASDKMGKLVKNSLFLLANSVFVTSHGLMIDQGPPGVMKSGSYLTSSSNSRIRTFLASLRGSYAIAMGDDCLEQRLGHTDEEIIQFYRAHGHVVKGVPEDYDHYFEFCSKSFVDHYSFPTDPSRTLFRLLSSSPTGPIDALARLEQFKHEMRHSPDLPTFLHVITRVGWPRKSELPRQIQSTI